MNEADERRFREMTAAILRRFGEQNGKVFEEEEVTGMAARLQELVAERGPPPPLEPGETGEPEEMPPEKVAPLVARLLGDGAGAAGFATPVRQLVKACFQPEFKKCRESYREAAADGTCRRQQPARARERVSGSHCVDCPYWISLEPEQHGNFLAGQWRAGAAEFAAQRGVFLPEDFRALRRHVRAIARDAKR